MKVQAALKVYKTMEKFIKVQHIEHISMEQMALRTIVSAFLKDKLVIKQLKQKENKWNNFLSKL